MIGLPRLLVLLPAAFVAGQLFPMDVPCPQSLPLAACFGHSGGPAEDLLDVDLPLLETVEYVQDLLQEAVKVEHSTIPLYLTTLYSIVNQSSFEASTIRGVVMEEMLHMVQAANVLNAIGGAPNIDYPGFIPQYPLVLPLINVSASITWFSNESIQHYQILESTPPGGYNASISAAYKHIISALTSLCQQHGERAVFTGNASLQVETSISNGESANKVHTLKDASNALLGVADQGGGCPVMGHPWPQLVNISAGPLGHVGDYSHAARFTEILAGRRYRPSDAIGHPTGAALNISWSNALRFTPNPTVTDFLPQQCVEGGSWVHRPHTFFVQDLWKKRKSDMKKAWQKTSSWQECAELCMAWTVKSNSALEPCAMWSWQDNKSLATADVPFQTCLLAQYLVPPNTTEVPGFQSGCQYGSICTNKLPHYPNASWHAVEGEKAARHGVGGYAGHQYEVNSTASIHSTNSSRKHRHPSGQNGTGQWHGYPRQSAYTDAHDAETEAEAHGPGQLQEECAKMHARVQAFSGNYTTFLVSLHKVFNGYPELLDSTLPQMYALKYMAIDLMTTPDPRIPQAKLGVGPSWEYVGVASQYEARGRQARPLARSN